MGNNNTKGELTAKKQLPEALERNKWKKGESGNPNGRPKGSVSVVEALKRKLEEVPEGQTKTYLELLVSRYMKNAIQDGDTQLIRDLINRVDGMPTQRQETDITSGGIPLLSTLKDVSNNNSSQEAQTTQEEN